MKIKINLFRKISIFSIFLIIFTVLVSYVLSIFFADSFYIKRIKREILATSIQTKNLMKNPNNSTLLEEYIDNIRDSKGINIYLGNLQPQKALHHKRYKNRYENLDEGFHIISLQNNNITLLAYKEVIGGKNLLVITTSLSVMSSHRHEVYLLNLITFIIAMVVSIVISRIFTKRITDNIKSLNRVAQKISRLDFSEKSSIKTSDELMELSQNINTMADNIKSSMENLNTFVSNASHELKTPIAVINTHAQLLMGDRLNRGSERNYHKVILKESKYMDTLVKDLLLLSKLSSNFNLEKEEFNLKDLLKESMEKFEFLELKKDLTLEIDLKDMSMKVNKKLFRIVLDNLVQNSLKYSPENSLIKVYSKEGKIFFENPIYIEEVDREKLFEPFFRGKNATELNIEGSGLGLSLIKKILDLHKANYNIVIENERFIFSFDILR